MSSVAKNIEIRVDSPTGFDEALQLGIKQASEPVRNIRIKDHEVLIEGGKVTVYRAQLTVTFLID
jgi:flavin-binding protein dodecin